MAKPAVGTELHGNSSSSQASAAFPSKNYSIHQHTNTPCWRIQIPLVPANPSAERDWGGIPRDITLGALAPSGYIHPPWSAELRMQLSPISRNPVNGSEIEPTRPSKRPSRVASLLHGLRPFLGGFRLSGLEDRGAHERI